ncbi:MAG: site-2 protease family protein [bacterium]
MLLNLLSSNATLLQIFIILAGFIFSIGFHEFAHAKSAQMFGDNTPVYDGRVTLNPIAHLDPIGTLFIFLAPFGWGKPVEVNPQNMGMYPERKYLISSLAGPVANMFLSLIILLISWGFVFSLNNFLGSMDLLTAQSIFDSLKTLFFINISLAIFNLIPIPPLDGSKIFSVILPYDARMKFEPFILKYGIIVLLVIMLPIFGGNSIIGIFITPLISLITNGAYSLIM